MTQQKKFAQKNELVPTILEQPAPPEHFDRTGDEYISEKRSQQPIEKKLLSEFIVDNYIPNYSSVAIDAGSTLQLIVERMMDRRNYLSILTNNMTAFRENSRQRVEESQNEFILTGGKYVALFDALLGNETLTSFDQFNPHIVIIGVSGITFDQGVFCHGNDELKVKEMLFNKNTSTILVPVDYSKLGRTDSYLFGKIADFKKGDNINRIVVTIPPCKTADKEGDQKEEYRLIIESYSRDIKKLQEGGVTLVEVPTDYEGAPS